MLIVEHIIVKILQKICLSYQLVRVTIIISLTIFQLTVVKGCSFLVLPSPLSRTLLFTRLARANSSNAALSVKYFQPRQSPPPSPVSHRHYWSFSFCSYTWRTYEYVAVTHCTQLERVRCDRLSCQSCTLNWFHTGTVKLKQNTNCVFWQNQNIFKTIVFFPAKYWNFKNKYVSRMELIDINYVLKI